MKIAYIVPSLVQEGLVTVPYDLVIEMCNHGHQCEVFYFEDRFPLFDFPCKTTKISFGDSIDFDDFDVIHSHGLRPDMYVAIHKKKKCKAMCVTTSHNFVFADLISDHGYIKGILGGICWIMSWIRFDKIVVLTNTALEYYKRYVSLKKMSVVYNTRAVRVVQDIDVSDKAMFDDIKGKGCGIIGSVCRVTDRKGLEDIVKAMPLLDNFRYIIVGDGSSLPKLKALAVHLGVEDKIQFIGSRKNGNRYIPYFDVVCMPSRSEGFPLVLLESALFKKSVVSSDIPVYKEVFDDSEIIACNTKDPEIIASAIQRAFAERKMRGERIYNKYMRCYSTEIFYKNYLKVYESGTNRNK